MIGWIKLHRQIRNHWVFKNANYFKAWVVIISEVNHKSAKVLIEGELIDCKRGQSINSLATWVRILGDDWTIQKLRTFLKLLEKDKMIKTEGLRKTTRLSVCNYESYQSEQQGDNKDTTSKQQGDNKEVTTNKNDNKEKNEKEEKEINRAIALESDFEIFWNAYDKKIDYKKTKAKFISLSGVKRQQALNTVLFYVKKTEEKKYRKNPWTWLNGECWKDELAVMKIEDVQEPKRNYTFAELMERDAITKTNL
jgi:hypothetical protein